jgi:hypothetical protein
VVERDAGGSLSAAGAVNLPSKLDVQATPRCLHCHSSVELLSP